MKLLRVTAQGLPLFKEKLDLSFYAQQRVAEEDKMNLYSLFSNIYLNPANAFIGINASGKTSVLKVLLLALGIINNEPINHINTKEILGNTEKAVLNVYFYSETTKEICRLETVITSKNTKVEGVVYSIESESLWSKKAEEVTTRKAMLDFEEREPFIVRDEQESFLSDDVSIMIAYNKKTGEHIKVVSMLLFTNVNVLPFSEGIPVEVISYLDPTIEKLYFDEEPKRAHWSEIGQLYHNDKIIDEYIDEAISKVDVEAIKKANLKVVVDCGSGAGSYTAPYLIRKLGCDVTTLNCQADGFFPGRDPEPIEENLQELINVVKQLNADIGLAHDGDADRTICIDEKGNFVLGDKTFSLVEKQMLKENNGGTIVTTVATSQAIYDIAEEYNGEVIATAVGDLLVARKLKDENGLFGGEENGGLIFPDFVYGRDAVMTVAKILETIAKEKKPLSKLVEELPVYYATKTKIECSDDLKDEVMNNIADEIKTTTDFELDTTDGVKILKEDGWVIIRPSGTEPIFRCFAESDSQEKADAMTEWGLSLIKKYKH